MPTTKLRQDNVRTLAYQGPSGKRQCIYWDEALENFGLRVYPSGMRTYVCSYRIRGRKRLAKIGRVNVLTLDEARKKAKALLGKVADNKDPKEEADRERKLKTVDQLCTAYVENHAKKKKKTWKDDKSTLERNVRPKLGARLAISVVSGDIEPIHATIGADHPSAANKLLEVVRKMFNWGEVAGYVPKGFSNPTKGIVPFRTRKRRRYITTTEMPRYLVALEQEDNDYARHGLWLLLLMGLRSAELLNAKWIDIAGYGTTSNARSSTNLCGLLPSLRLRGGCTFQTWRLRSCATVRTFPFRRVGTGRGWKRGNTYHRHLYPRRRLDCRACLGFAEACNRRMGQRGYSPLWPEQRAAPLRSLSYRPT